MAFAVDYGTNDTTVITYTKGNKIMANERKTYNFRTQSGQSALAARIASIKTKHIEELIKLTMGVSINIMQRFNMPQKCEAAIYLVDNAPQTVLQSVIAQNLARYEEDVKNTTQGRPVHLYRHDPEHDNRTFNRNDVAEEAPQPVTKVRVENVPRDVQSIVDDMTSKPTAKEEAKAVLLADDETEEKIDALNEVLRDIINSKKGAMDEARVYEIAREEDAKVSKFIETAINAAIKEIHIPKPTIVHVEYKEKDGEVIKQDFGLQHRCFADLVAYVQCGYPVFLPGPAGSGKTTAAMNLAKIFKLPFYHNGAVDTEYKLLGFENVGGKFTETQFYLAYKNGGVYLFDEIDASNPQALVALNAALENGKCVFGNGECVSMHADFKVVAAANTYGQGATHEYVGRTKLDAATIDRFVMLDWGYDEELERALALREWDDASSWVDTVQKYRRAVKNSSGIKHVVSPRASLRGARMLKAGIEMEKVLNAVVFKGLPSEQIATLKRAA
jgi:MoxR-like ATPase